MANGHLGSAGYYPFVSKQLSEVSFTPDAVRAKDAANHQYRRCRGLRIDGKLCEASVGLSGYCSKHKRQAK